MRVRQLALTAMAKLSRREGQKGRKGEGGKAGRGDAARRVAAILPPCSAKMAYLRRFCAIYGRPPAMIFPLRPITTKA